MKNKKLNDNTIKNAFTFINRYYYIENKSINYSNALGQHINDGLLKFYEIINEIIDNEEVKFLTDISKHQTNKVLSKDEWCILEQLIEKLKKDKNFTILPQTLTSLQCNLINETIKYIEQYIKDNKLEYTFLGYNNPSLINYNKEDIYSFKINYNSFEYRYTIRKIDNRIIFRINLHNNKEYRINLYNKTDFLNILNCMYNDI